MKKPFLKGLPDLLKQCKITTSNNLKTRLLETLTLRNHFLHLKLTKISLFGIFR